MIHIRRIEVDKLFGLYDHRIDLHPEEHITLLHGPNGVGKTALLRLLYGLLNGNFAALCSVPFHEFRVYLQDNRWLRVRQDENAAETNLFVDSQVGVQIDVYRGKKLLSGENPTLLHEQEIRYESLLRYIPSLRRSAPGKWFTRPASHVMTTAEALLHVLSSDEMNELPISENQRREMLASLRPQPLAEILSESKAYLIGTNRLLPPSKVARRRPSSVSAARWGDEPEEEQPESAVQHHANVIRDTIGATLAQYSSVSSQRDRTFPERLVHGRMKRNNLSDDKLRERFVALENRRSDLEAAGLLDADAAGRPFRVPDSLDETTLTVLSVYVEDTETKLAVFNDVEARIALLKQIVEKRFLHTKKFEINRKRGFIFRAENKELTPEQLSSGEQHELVLFSELLFTVPDGSLILIDEPELSLHVAWQLEFLRDLEAVTRIRPMDILIATHSPWIVNERWDLTERLSESQPEELGSETTKVEAASTSRRKTPARVAR